MGCLLWHQCLIYFQPCSIVYQAVLATLCIILCRIGPCYKATVSVITSWHHDLFQETYIFIGIFYHSSTLKCHRMLKLTLKENKCIPVFYHQGIISHAIPSISIYRLTHLTLDQIDAISQMTFSNTFSWMKRFVFRFNFHWSLFLRVQLTISQHWCR